MNVLHLQTGTAYPYNVIGLGTLTNAAGSYEVLDSVSLGGGLASAPVLHIGGGNDGGFTVITQSSGGGSGGGGGGFECTTCPTSGSGLPATSERKSWREIIL